MTVTTWLLRNDMWGNGFGTTSRMPGHPRIDGQRLVRGCLGCATSANSHSRGVGSEHRSGRRPGESLVTGRELRPGTLLATRYEIVERLGSGGFGSTFRALDRSRFNADCVVKELLSVRQENDVARRLFEREARVLLDLHHPQIPTMQAYFEEEGRFYLVQDFVDGETLDERLRRDTRLPEVEVRRIVESLLDVLSYLHGRTPPVIHRDIKPANIMLGANGAVYLIDFGAVREAIGGSPEEQGTTIGTAGYTPREQAVGRPRPSSDLYALGATALEAVTGLHPLEWHSARTGKLDWKGRVSCSDAFEAFLDGMLADVQERFDTAERARTALRSSDIVAPAPTPVSTPDVPEPASGSRTLRIVGVAALIAAAILAITRPWSTTTTPSGSVPPAATTAAGAQSPDTLIPAPAPVTAPTPAADTARRAVTHTAPTAPVTRRDSQAAVPKEQATSTTPQVVDPPPTTAASPELRETCARLLERISLGERLSDAETAKLKKECRTGSS